MQRRREVLGALGAACAAGLAGCQGIVRTEVDATASPASLASDAAADAGYDHEGTEREHTEEDLSVFPFTVHLEATWWLARYRRDPAAIDVDGVGDAGPAGFEVLSTPTASFRGEQLNPIPDLDGTEVVQAFSSEQSDEPSNDFSPMVGDVVIDGVARIDETEREVLGESVRVGVHEAVVRPGPGEPGEQYLFHLARVEHEDDVVLPVGYHRRESDERERIADLLGAVEHPVEA